jgi:hypothetical protein
MNNLLFCRVSYTKKWSVPVDSKSEKDQSPQEKARLKEVEEWLNQVHFGSCCRDEVVENSELPSKKGKPAAE